MIIVILKLHLSAYISVVCGTLHMQWHFLPAVLQFSAHACARFSLHICVALCLYYNKCTHAGLRMDSWSMSVSEAPLE